MEAWLLALFFLIIGATLGFGLAGIGLSVVIVRAATSPRLLTPQPHAAHAAPPAHAAPELQATGSSTASPDARGATEDTLPGVVQLAARKTRQKPRCGFCESVRAALGLKTRQLTGEQ